MDEELMLVEVVMSGAGDARTLQVESGDALD